MVQIKKRYIVLSAIALILFAVLFSLSTIIKNYVNKNSRELLGRKVELGGLHLNYFKVAVRANNLLIYEANEVDTFAGFNEFYINFDPIKLLSNEYSFSELSLDSLFVNVIHDDEVFNFSDLIPPTDSTEVEESDTIVSDPFKFSLHNLKLSRSNVCYYDKQVDNRLEFDDLSLDLPLIAWDSESSDVGVEFEFGEHGKVYVGAIVDQVKEEYLLDFKVDSMELNMISKYAKEYIDAGGISGYLAADLKIKGNMQQTDNILVKGSAGIDSLRIWEPDGNDICKLDAGSVQMDSLDVGNSFYHFSDITLTKPVVIANLFEDMSNIERMLLQYLETDSALVDSVAVDVAQDSVPGDSVTVRYLIDNFNIHEGEILLTDNTLNRPFQYDFKEIDLTVKHIANDADTIPVSFFVNMNDQGSLNGKSTFSMLDNYKFNLDAELGKLRLMSFSPYTEFYIARPIIKGDFNYDLTINMTQKHMYNNNVISINELEFGAKTDDKPIVKAPVKLGLYLMKDAKDVIAIDLPVEGNPSDPDFSVTKLVWKTFTNLLIKVAASPFNALANIVGTQPEELENIPMEYAQDSLSQKQRHTLDLIAEILTKKPELIFTFEQQTDPEQEKDVMAVLMAKKTMLSQTMPTTTEEEISTFNNRLKNMTNDDPEFTAYVTSKVPGVADMGIARACRSIVGENELEDAFIKLLNNRNELVSNYLLVQKSIDPASIEVTTVDLRNIPEELQSAKYSVEVSVK